jgi:hypothetical protein
MAGVQKNPLKGLNQLMKGQKNKIFSLHRGFFLQTVSELNRIVKKFLSPTSNAHYGVNCPQQWSSGLVRFSEQDTPPPLRVQLSPAMWVLLSPL